MNQNPRQSKLSSLLLLIGCILVGGTSGALISLYLSRRMSERIDYIDRKVGRHETDIMMFLKHQLTGRRTEE